LSCVSARSAPEDRTVESRYAAACDIAIPLEPPHGRSAEEQFRPVAPAGTMPAAGRMSARIAADGLVLIHLAFVAFVVLGGLLVAWRTYIAWLHLPAAAWGAWIELSGRICPLTPLENHFRGLAGQTGYPGGFVEHYLIPILYPAGLTPQWQGWLGALVVLVNLLVYAGVVLRRRRRR
jgi:hypothetical protein